MKKLLAVILTGCMMLALVGCGEKAQTDTTSQSIEQPAVRRRIEIGFNSEFNSRRLPIRSRSNIYDCTHISEQPHIIVALFGSRNYPVLKQGHDLFRLCNNRELKSQPFEL